MMNKRVVITGMGTITPIGNNINTFKENLFKGVCGINKLTGLDEWNLSIKVAGQIKDFDAKALGMDAASIRRSDLFNLYGNCAAIQAVTESGLVSGENIEPSRFGVYVGSGIGGMNTFIKQTHVMYTEGAERISPLFIPTMIGNICAGNIAIRFNAQGPCLPVVSACSTSTHAIGEAFRAIKHGYADAIIAGGAEATVNPLAIGGFANIKALSTTENPEEACRPFDARRNGFVLAEGAGIMVLEEYEHAVKRGANIIAEVVGYGNSCDAHHYTAPRPDGTTTAAAVSQSLKEAGYTEDKMLYINAHGTSTPLNDKCETTAFKLALGEDTARKAMISSSKSMTGHMLGATGAVELIVSALALQNGILPPTIGYAEPDPECDLDYIPNQARDIQADFALSSSLGFGGHNACVTLKKYSNE
ncbi:MAG: beta-ketoacyl-ACP synthase II [Bacteroidaceae bacterium]|nr:beta-ketoacyl-ACP synthase II [Bacteroidaceae bacterium]MBO5932708.1 beta-ketoacyl-ACP synthase II [Bacteroidaceae bacterium]